MKRILQVAATVLSAMLLCENAFAQKAGQVKALIVDNASGEPVSFATVSLTLKGEQKARTYSLTTEKGEVSLQKVKGGEYVFKVELMGYKTFEKALNIDGNVDLGQIKLEEDKEVIDAASISAVGNPIVMKKDTIEYNASSFKTTDNDVLEDLLKKLPGIEIGEDGSIKANGQTISKITIDGKTFFLDDPQLASKNIPAKLIHKLKVIEKKSEQAEFTGIDDGEEEHVIDLSIKPGMMNGVFGNLMGGAGHDIPSTSGYDGDYRFQGAGFAGRYTKKSQISVILNANNTNNRGFDDLSGAMMSGMRGGGMGRRQGGFGGGNGITTSYMGGVNAVFNLFDDKMELGSNYLYSNSSNDVAEQMAKRTYLGDYDLLYNSDGLSTSNSYGHRFGVRMEHKFSEQSSIIFEPQVNFGGGDFAQTNTTTSLRDNLDGSDAFKLNDAFSNNIGQNKNVNTSAFMLYRQRLGIPGRTMTVMGRLAYSNNNLDAVNDNGTNAVFEDGTPDAASSSRVWQTIDNKSNSMSAFGRATYTEPLGNSFYAEANYGFSWNRSSSEKDAFDRDGVRDEAYSNTILNNNTQNEIGANLKYQKESFSAQVGLNATQTTTRNETSSRLYEDRRWNWAPQIMLWGDIGESISARLFYRGSSNQPSTSQLMPVPDNSDPLNINFGNPTLKPYFSHSMRGRFSYTNKKTFSSIFIGFNGGWVQNPIVNAIWYSNAGGQYNMPYNGPDSGNAGFNMFFNSPIAKSNFSVSNATFFNWSAHSSYVGTDNSINERYGDPTEDYYKFMEDFIKDHPDLGKSPDFTCNATRTFFVMEALRGTYRSDAIEIVLGGRTSMNSSHYTIAQTADKTLTWNNQLSASVNWTWDMTGIGIKSDFNYNWYRGYQTQQPSEYVLNAEISKLLFKNKMTLALKGYDILGQARNITVSDNSNFHSEAVNNTLGRYVVLSLTWRFGTFEQPGGGARGPHGPGPGPRR